MKIHVHTLGCKVNQFESQALETMLTDRLPQIVTGVGTARRIRFC